MARTVKPCVATCFMDSLRIFWRMMPANSSSSALRRAHALGGAILILFHALLLRPVATLPSEYSLRVSREAPREREVRSVREGAANGLDMSRRDHVERGERTARDGSSQQGRAAAPDLEMVLKIMPNTYLCSLLLLCVLDVSTWTR